MRPSAGLRGGLEWGQPCGHLARSQACQHQTGPTLEILGEHRDLPSLGPGFDGSVSASHVIPTNTLSRRFKLLGLLIPFMLLKIRDNLKVLLFMGICFSD